VRGKAGESGYPPITSLLCMRWAISTPVDGGGFHDSGSAGCSWSLAPTIDRGCGTGSKGVISRLHQQLRELPRRPLQGRRQGEACSSHRAQQMLHIPGRQLPEDERTAAACLLRQRRRIVIMSAERSRLAGWWRRGKESTDLRPLAMMEPEVTG